MVDVNVKGVLYGNAATLPVTNPQVFGEITNVPSISGLQVSPAGAVYCATKYAADNREDTRDPA
ncbi:SDR family NAD(P)-dependent oxidoreductase [Burkholderia sp. Bp8963]|uniref:SDR family NAD(P)-dependent oxidoreductase n=1 Tax=Burkholderia sp. Bp8963 TaxID=2184547 RepID=UPI000F5A4746|nr:SDR family NAD(P)-dependent oxidoreductase [Burkholderia sp. Bp8963]RQS62939.1 SDR family NAD(P)-dependent oxidoreductase [Burkholderia sp. Bp8963]